MKLPRREFIEVIGATVASLATSNLVRSRVAAAENEALEKGGWRLQVTPVGEIISFTDGKTELINRRLGDNRPRVVIGGMRQYTCDRPSVFRREGPRLVSQYDFSGRDRFSVTYELELVNLREGIVALKQKVGIVASTKISENVELVLPRNLQLPFENRKVFLPLKNGIGRRKPILGYESENEYVYVMAGSHEAIGKPQLLAIPMVDEYADQTDLRLTHCTDPYFSSYFRLPHGEKVGNFNYVYLGRVGLEGKEERTVYTGLHRGGEKAAMEVFYATSLGEVSPGPDWLHDIAMVNYDYLSKNGQGWFRDIDALTKLVAPEDRNKVFLALHAWYDYVGRYSFDWRKGVLNKQWTAFGSAFAPAVQALPDAPDNGTGVVWHRDSVKNLRPVPMSLADVHRRIHYAKDKGFRVGLYYGDGTNAGEDVKDIYDPSKVLRWGGWVGPDTKGKMYAQNPLHPEVREFYLKYIRALLDEYGKEVDGFIWDETFVVATDELGPAAAPGYASRGMMTLTKELTSEVTNFSSQLAFFASDDIGAFYKFFRFDEAAPYALVSHGTYQDSWCTPEGWSYGLFPNYRNVLWSCNWAPVTRFYYTRYGVETFGVPVAISNGAMGDDIGIGDMSPEQQKQIMDLFDKRKRERMEISWIEEEPWNPKYQGKEVKFKWSL